MYKRQLVSKNLKLDYFVSFIFQNKIHLIMCPYLYLFILPLITLKLYLFMVNNVITSRFLFLSVKIWKCYTSFVCVGAVLNLKIFSSNILGQCLTKMIHGVLEYFEISNFIFRFVESHSRTYT